MKKLLILLFFIVGISNISTSQVTISNELENLDYSKPVEYEIGGIVVNGVKYIDHSVLIALSGLQVGDIIKVPGDKITEAIERLWKQGLFADVKIIATRVVGDKIFLELFLIERPRLASFSFKGVKKGEAEDIRDKIKLLRGTQVTDNTIKRAINTISNFYIGKGFYNVTVDVEQEVDTVFLNHINLKFIVDKGRKVKIESINFEGNEVIKDRRIRRAMKDTKQKRWYGMFKPSKFNKNNYAKDLNKIIDLYNERGYRNARILSDSVYKISDNRLKIDIELEEGNKFYFRNITWVGNAKYTEEQLSHKFGVKKGDVFDQKVMEERLFLAPDALSSLYYDDGYLFFNITPVETNVVNDSIDFEMRIVEGKQARFNRILISGNLKTNDHVIRREIRTYPGDLFNRSNIIRTQRELAQLGYFDIEKFDVKTIPHPYDGTVDIEYILEEKPSDQLQLQGGWGAGIFLATVSVTLTNLAMKDFFKKEAWRPFPTGDGQRLSLAVQSNGTYYQAYSISFFEPWLGGRRSNSLSVSFYHTIHSLGYNLFEINDYMKVTGVSVGLGVPLQYPDDYFRLSNYVNYERYNLNNYGSYFIFTTGKANNFSFRTELSRNSVDSPIFPRRGGLISLSLQVTPPYSLFKPNKWWIQPAVDKTGKTDEEIIDLENKREIKQIAEKYKWIEYHKWKFKFSTFNALVQNLVLNSKIEFGWISYFNKDVGYSPFETFQLGGDGLSGYNVYGTEIIGLRGYDDSGGNSRQRGSLTPDKGGNLYQKVTFELRYPLSLNPNATFYVLTFVEAGNAWYDIRDYSPFELKRSAGVGIRFFSAMIGMLGVDWGYGFDPIPNRPNSHKSQFAFVLGQQF